MTMDLVEHIFRTAEFESVWARVWEVWVTHPSTWQELAFMTGQCIVWLIIFCSFYRCKRFFHGRERKARQKKLLKAHVTLSEREQAAVDRYWPWPEVHPVVKNPSGLVPRLPRTRPRTGATQTPAAEEVPCLASVTMSTPECFDSNCRQRLKESASELRAPRQGIHCLGNLIQTQLNPSTSSANKLRGILASDYCRTLTAQLGIWRACFHVDGEVKTLKLDETDRVPVILYASLAAGLLTVEGINLKDATIQITSGLGTVATISETECNEGAGGLEVLTCLHEFNDVECNAKMYVLAFREIDKDGHELRVSSLPVQIQDDNLRTVIRDIFPYALLVICASKHILSSLIYATPIVAWLIPFMIIASTQFLPESTEATIKLLVMKLIFHMFSSFICALQSIGDIHAYFSSMKNGEDVDFPSRKDPKPTRPRSRKRQASHPAYEESSSGESSEAEEYQRMKGTKLEDVDFGVSHDSGSVLGSKWKWPIYDKIHHQDGRSELKLRKEEEDENVKTKMAPFEVVYLNLNGFPWAKQVEVNLHSPFLKELLGGKKDRWRCKKIVRVDGPELFRGYEILRERQKAVETRNKVELQHITHLLRFMDEELEEINSMYEAMKSERVVTWDLLWALIPPGERIIWRDNFTNEDMCADVLWTEYRKSQEGLFLVMEVTKWDYNCKSWSQYTHNLKVPSYEGDRKISSLDIHPLRFEDDPKATEETLLATGKRFCELSMMQSNYYMNYKGPLMKYVFLDGCYRAMKENADGRIMIDLGGFSKINSNYPLGSAKPPCEVIRDNIVNLIDITSDPNRIFAPCFVYGFSFRLKKWGCFSVCGISEIKFNDLAYDDLVMAADKKTLTECLVKEHLKEVSNKDQPNTDGADVIANKGDGCIFLCYGPPGTGKTLTAESLSEKLQCPLWSLSVFELGTTPAALETMLVKVLDVVTSWGAILLLDEADVYLERRSSDDLARNAMTGVFLRQLEYYRGVLFLTTNRDSEFDDAICSRISMFLYYGKHDEHQRSEIWTNTFRRVGLQGITSENLAEFSKPHFNGREIRKIMKVAQTLAKSKSEELHALHIRQALTAYEACTKLRTSLVTPSAGLPTHHHPDHSPSKLQEDSCSKSALAQFSMPITSEFQGDLIRVDKLGQIPQLDPSSSSSSQPSVVEYSRPSNIGECSAGLRATD